MKKRNKFVDICKKVLGVVVELGAMEVCSHAVDLVVPEDTNPIMRGAMKTGGMFIGGYIGSKAGEYANDVIDRGLKLATKYTKIVDEEDDNEAPEMEADC